MMVLLSLFILATYSVIFPSVQKLYCKARINISGTGLRKLPLSEFFLCLQKLIRISGVYIHPKEIFYKTMHAYRLHIDNDKANFGI